MYRWHFCCLFPGFVLCFQRHDFVTRLDFNVALTQRREGISAATIQLRNVVVAAASDHQQEQSEENGFSRGWRPSKACGGGVGLEPRGDKLLDDWHSLTSRELMMEHAQTLEPLDAHSRSLDELLSQAEIDVVAFERDWERLQLECAYMNSPESLRTVRDALSVAYAAHAGQFRRSGEPYVVHPVEVASLLASLQMDVETVAAGLLHDTVEDTAVTFEQLESRYGITLRKIIEGETKVSKLPGIAIGKAGREKCDAEQQDDDGWPVTESSPPPRHVVDEAACFTASSPSSDMGPADFTTTSKINGRYTAKLSGEISQASDRHDASRPASFEAEASCEDDDAFSIAEEQAENLRQMFIAMTDDYRIIIVKLADRLHNMRTLEHMPRHKQRKIARETIEIFAPLAHRLGIWQFKAELEEIAFRYAHPHEYETLRRAIARRRRRYRSALEGCKLELKRAFAADENMSGVSVAISGRTKELYSLWLKLRKMAAAARDQVTDQNHYFDVDAVEDVVALRVVLDIPRLSCDEPVETWRERTVLLCYRALSLVQHLDHCEVAPEQSVKDYISYPKPNGYQSLHAFIRRKPENQIVEVQIRSQEMHETAEHGIAAHWLYKESFFLPRPSTELKRSNQYAVTWLDSVKTWQHEIRSSREFIDTIRRELLGKRVFVFLRDGKILDLSRGATVLDAAFHIHTDVGLHAVAAYINGQEVQFSYELRNGDVVSIVTSEDAQPQRDWMQWANRRSTRSKLRAYFKANER